MKELNALQSTVNQPRLAIQNSETKKIFVEKVQHRRSRNGEQLFPQPATPLSLSRKQGRRKFAGFSLKPNASFPIRVLIVLLNVAGERVAVTVQQPILQPCGPAAHNDMLVHFHVTHRAVLVLEAAFESALPAAKERQLAETCIAVAERAPQKEHLQCDVISIEVVILDRPAHLFREQWCEGLVGIEQKNPIVGDREGLHGPLPLFGPPAAIGELDYRRVERARDLGGFVAAVGGDNINLAHTTQRFQAARQNARLITHKNDDADREGDSRIRWPQRARLSQGAHSDGG